MIAFLPSGTGVPLTRHQIRFRAITPNQSALDFRAPRREPAKPIPCPLRVQPPLLMHVASGFISVNLQ
jgi:hypothetical protein